jgi:uncharacterized protein
VTDRLHPAAGLAEASAISTSAPAGSTATPLSPRARVALRVVAAVLLALVVLDLVRPPAHQVTARLLLGGIHLYQATLSPRMPGLGIQCRFTPTCSHYAEGAIVRYGALFGSLRAVWRIARCGPWTPRGTIDPP